MTQDDGTNKAPLSQPENPVEPSVPGQVTPEQIIGFLQQLLTEVIQPTTAALPGAIIQFLQQVLAEVIQPTATQFQLAAAQSVEQITPGVIKHFFQDLIPPQKVDLYRRLELKKALTVSKIQSEDEDWVISKAFKEAISWKPDDSDDPEKAYHPNWIVPRKNGFFTVDAETSLVAHQVGKFVSKGSSNQEVSLFGGLDSDFEGESSGNSELSAESNTYLLAEYTIPKLILSVDWDNIQLNPHFKEKVDKILIDEEWSSFVKLNYLLNEYGYFVPLKFTIGGKISAQSEVNSNIDSESEQYTSFESDFASRINLFGRPESEASGKSEGEMEASQNMSSESGMELEYYGGLGSAVTNPIGWMMSLNSYKTWTVIKYSELVPIICFFDDKLRNKVIRAFMRFSYYPGTDKPLLLNGISYASLAIELISQRSFLEDSGEDSPPESGESEEDTRTELAEDLSTELAEQKQVTMLKLKKRKRKAKKFKRLFSYKG